MVGAREALAPSAGQARRDPSVSSRPAPAARAETGGPTGNAGATRAALTRQRESVERLKRAAGERVRRRAELVARLLEAAATPSSPGAPAAVQPATARDAIVRLGGESLIPEMLASPVAFAELFDDLIAEALDGDPTSGQNATVLWAFEAMRRDMRLLEIEEPGWFAAGMDRAYVAAARRDEELQAAATIAGEDGE
jgi:hypothetical protein